MQVYARFSASFIKIQWKLNETVLPFAKSIWKIFSSQGQVTAKIIVGSGKNLISLKILCLSWPTASLMTIESKLKAVWCPQHFLHYKSIGNFFHAQGRVTPKPIFRSGRKLNSSEILCLSLISASLSASNKKWRLYHVHNIFSCA